MDEPYATHLYCFLKFVLRGDVVEWMSVLKVRSFKIKTFIFHTSYTYMDDFLMQLV